MTKIPDVTGKTVESVELVENPGQTDIVSINFTDKTRLVIFASEWISDLSLQTIKSSILDDYGSHLNDD